MINVISIDEIKDKDLVIISKQQLLDLLVEVNVKTSVDKRVKWINRKTAIAKYGVTRFWLQSAENDEFSVLQVFSGKSKNSPKKYLESSLIEEQKRQAG